mmetsp:Transcript_33312/g.82534  ORF Transcript_33312/g.82534 Transcript_33312/m.82534 type:complete len:208 (-) Transcript_33312:602-1225(-)
MPGTSTAATTTSNSLVSSCRSLPGGPVTTMPRIRVGAPDASVSYSRSFTFRRVKILAPLASRYCCMGLWRYSCGDPSSIRSTDASLLTANSWKMVSMHRADMWSQSIKPRAYAMGSHIRSIDPRLPPLLRNHSLNEMSSRFLTSSMAPSKSTRPLTTGLVAKAIAFATLSPNSSWLVVAKALRPLKGAPTPPILKSSAPTSPPLLTN